MMPFNGINARSIAIMDNLSVHHVREVLDLFNQAGILVLFLPPYSPDLNPMEEAFSYIKSYLRKHDELLQAVPNPQDIIGSAFYSITVNHCQSWIYHSGYNVNDIIKHVILHMHVNNYRYTVRVHVHDTMLIVNRRIIDQNQLSSVD